MPSRRALNAPVPSNATSPAQPESTIPERRTQTASNQSCATNRTNPLRSEATCRSEPGLGDSPGRDEPKRRAGIVLSRNDATIRAASPLRDKPYPAAPARRSKPAPTRATSPAQPSLGDTPRPHRTMRRAWPRPGLPNATHRFRPAPSAATIPAGPSLRDTPGPDSPCRFQPQRRADSNRPRTSRARATNRTKPFLRDEPCRDRTTLSNPDPPDLLSIWGLQPILNLIHPASFTLNRK